MIPAGNTELPYPVLFVELLLTRPMPHILIDGNQCRYWLRNYYKSAQELELEGNFYEYYRVYCPERYETDLLYFLTPELMQMLMALKGRYDIEIVNDKLYFYADFPASEPRPNKALYQEVFALLATVGQEFLENTKNYRHMVDSKSVDGKEYAGERLKDAKIPIIGSTPTFKL